MKLLLFFFFAISEILAISAEDFRKRANQAKSFGQYLEALENFRKSLQKNPYYLPAIIEYGELLLDLGYNTQAFEQAEKAYKQDPENRETSLLYAKSLIAQGELVKAQDFLEKKIQKYPDEIEYLFLKSQIYYQNGQLYLAQEKLRQILKREPGHLKAHLLLADLYSKQGRYDLAEKELEQAHRIQPENPDILIKNGDIALRETLQKLEQEGYYQNTQNSNLFQKAISYHQNALNYDPWKITANLAVAQIFVFINQCKEAIPFLDRILEINPQYFLAVYLKGYCASDLTFSLYSTWLKDDENNDLLRHALQRHLKKNTQSFGGALLQQAKYHLNEAKKLNAENLIAKAFYETKWAQDLYPDLLEAHENLLEHFRSQADFKNYEKTLRFLKQNSKKKVYQDLWEKWIYERKENLTYREGLWEQEKYSTPTPVFVFSFSPEDIMSTLPDAGESLAEKIEFALLNKTKVSPLPKEVLLDIHKELKKISLLGKPTDYHPVTAQVVFQVANQKIKEQNLPLWQKRDLQFAIAGQYKILPHGISILAKLIDLKNGLSIKEMRRVYTGKGYLRDVALAVAQFAEENIPFYGNIVKISQNHAILNIGKKTGLKIGQKVQILRQGKPIAELTIKKLDTDYSWAEVPFLADQRQLQNGDVAIAITGN